MITKFTQFVSGLSDLGKILLVIALITVIVALFVCLLIYPTMSKLAAIEEETIKEEQAIKQNLLFLSRKDKIVKEAKAVSPYLTENLPAENEVTTALLKKIEILASKANVTLPKENTLPTVQEENTVKYSAEVECIGKLTDIVTFMHLINSSDELIKVAKFNLGSKKADTDEIKATMTIVKMIVSNKPLPKPANPASSNTQPDAPKTTKN